MAPRAGFEPATRSNRVLFKCRTGDSRTYSRPAPASRGPGYTTSTRPSVGLGARSPAFYCHLGEKAHANHPMIKLSRSTGHSEGQGRLTGTRTIRFHQTLIRNSQRAKIEVNQQWSPYPAV